MQTRVFSQFALNATSMLDQPNTSIKIIFCSKSNRHRFTFLSKRILLENYLKPWRQLLQAALNQKELLVWRDSILQNSDAVYLGDQSINALFFKHIFEKREQEEKDRIENKRKIDKVNA